LTLGTGVRLTTRLPTIRSEQDKIFQLVSPLDTSSMCISKNPLIAAWIGALNAYSDKCALVFTPRCPTRLTKFAIPTYTPKSIVLCNTDGLPKLIYCASWLNGAPAREVFGLCAESASARVLCFTYFVVIHNTPERANGRLNQREKSVRTVKYKVPAQITGHASCRNKL